MILHIAQGLGLPVTVILIHWLCCRIDGSPFWPRKGYSGAGHYRGREANWNRPRRRK